MSRQFVGEVERDKEREIELSTKDNEVKQRQKRASESTQDQRKE
jgi:hypothetical protein